jgi:hypothetical protein
MEEQKKIAPESQEQMTNAQKILSALKKHRKEYLKSLPVAFVLSCLYVIGLPDYYTAQVVVVPESGGSEMGSLASLASSFGFSIGGGSKGGDAITPTLYPDFMSSVAFTTTLFDIKVQKDSDNRVMSYYDYLTYEQKSPWWDWVLESVTSLFGSKKEEREKKEKVNPFRLTPDQYSMVMNIQSKVKWDVDRRIEALTIRVTDQDPLVAATVADSVKERLQDALTEYRTQKARHDLAYIESLYKDAKVKYERSSEVYADFLDSNRDIMLETVRLRQTKLENELQLHYSNYTALSAQLLTAKAKVQEKTPAFTTLANATVPLGNAGPFRKRIVTMFLLFVFLCHSAWILYKEDQLKLLIGLDKRKSK